MYPGIINQIAHLIAAMFLRADTEAEAITEATGINDREEWDINYRLHTAGEYPTGESYSNWRGALSPEELEIAIKKARLLAA